MGQADPRARFERELSALTLRAALSLASRAVRRVQPILAFEEHGLDVSEAALSLADAAAYDRWVELDQAKQVVKAAAFDEQPPTLAPSMAYDSRSHAWDVRRAASELAVAGMAVLEIASGALNRELDFIGAHQALVAAVDFAVRAAEAGADALAHYTDDDEDASKESAPAISRWAQRWYQEAQLAREARSHDYERLRRLRAGVWVALGRPIDPSDAGPIGPLWPNDQPSWYREGRQRLLPEVDIRIVAVEDSATAAEIFEREASARKGADILSWDLVDEPEAVSRLAATISELYRLYRTQGRLAPTLLVFTRRISYDARERLIGAGATVFSSTGPWSGISRSRDELREHLRQVTYDNGDAGGAAGDA